MIKLGPGSYYGDVHRVRTVDELTYSESQYAPGLRIPRHEHAHPFFCLLVSGQCTEVIGPTTLELCPSSLTYHPAGVVHSNDWYGPGGRCFHIEIAPARMERLRDHIPILTRAAEFRGGPSWLALRVYHEYLNEDDCSPLAMEGLVLEMLADASRRQIHTPECRPPLWLRRVREVLDAHFAEAITLGNLAAEAGIDPDHLARVFRTWFGCTPGEYVRRLRVEFARHHISSSDMPLVEIALEAGFSDQSHLTKVFKRFTGVTPAELRKTRPARRTDTEGMP